MDVNEAGSAGLTEFASNLALGVDSISQSQTITFVKYVRVILPLDGFVFWVRADLYSGSSLLNYSLLNTTAMNKPATVSASANTITVSGSLHYVTENNQDEAEGFATNRVTFTSENEIELLNTVSPRVIYIGQWEGLQFAFANRNSFYRQANLFHYQGYAVYPSMATQLINDINGFSQNRLVVSNSLPVWLTLNKYVPMYPSFLVDDNIMPNWCAVHIEPSQTYSLQATPFIDSNGSSYQLYVDKVRLTLYGLRNDQVTSFINYLNDFFINYETLGLMNIPVIRDEKATQMELGIISMKKTIEFEVSYYQESIRTIARQYITSFVAQLYITGRSDPAIITAP